VVNFAQFHKDIGTERYAVLVDCQCLSANPKYLHGDGEHPCFGRVRWCDAVDADLATGPEARDLARASQLVLANG